MTIDWTQPDPRDALIAELVEALREADVALQQMQRHAVSFDLRAKATDAKLVVRAALAKAGAA